MKNTYKPNPIKIDDVVLPESLDPLLEQLAEHIHDLWALERIDQGWKYGETRNDETKEHPCLVAYDELSEGEKRFDRGTALGALKAIVSLGYKIESP